MMIMSSNSINNGFERLWHLPKVHPKLSIELSCISETEVEEFVTH